MRAHLPSRLTRRAGDARSYRYVFVVTYGRSGSTLLMGLLNTIPGYRIRGENDNALHHLFRAYASVRDAYPKRAETAWSTGDPWYGADRWRPEEFRRSLVDAFVAQVLRPAPEDRVLGFKEIRYTTEHIRDLDPYLDFLRTAFPNSKIVFNHRLPTDVAKSAWWAENPKALERIKAADARLAAIPADDRHFHFHFDRIDDSLDTIRELFRFLGEEMDTKRVRATLETPHSYRPGERPVAAGSAAGRARTLARRVVVRLRRR
ncbi:sulfotransferase [Micromonospora mirobrigensis]|uniref:Sulfotransferase family protein n=1 Tax=Micromonospora mirobrigensis TaxID=262898 RepID=A0A1C4UGI2_9ACTN|nr:sulfotransferase [Micromonospora mirobrigensis]SCE70806.1 Sulfotransferase family protein [Micromonospora mirobrigensis]